MMSPFIVRNVGFQALAVGITGIYILYMYNLVVAGFTTRNTKHIKCFYTGQAEDAVCKFHADSLGMLLC